MLSEVQAELLESLASNYSTTKGTEMEVLKNVNFILFDNRKLLELAVEILGDGGGNAGVKKYVSNSCGRPMWKVKGSQDRDYTCLKNYCSCPSFLNQSKLANGKIYCKHLLAIRLADMIGIEETESIADEKFVELLCQESSVSTAISSKPYRNWRK